MSVITVKKLKALLEKLPKEMDNFPVVMSTDPEGNGYSALYQLDPSAMEQDGRNFDMKWNEDGETQPASNVIVLWPS